MIGHLLLQLTPEQEDAVLLTRLQPGLWEHEDRSRCLVGAIALPMQEIPRVEWLLCEHTLHAAPRYDWLCWRFGTERINTAIRNRILSNRLWRTLHAPKQESVLA